jgi:hypothetical protein
VLECFHIARRLERIARAFLYLPYMFLWLDASTDETSVDRAGDGAGDGAGGDRTHGVYLRDLLVERRRYFIANRTSLTNYGTAYRRGERVATAHVESTVNQAINNRMCKEQQMRWTRLGAVPAPSSHRDDQRCPGSLYRRSRW